MQKAVMSHGCLRCSYGCPWILAAVNVFQEGGNAEGNILAEILEKNGRYVCMTSIISKELHPSKELPY